MAIYPNIVTTPRRRDGLVSAVILLSLLTVYRCWAVEPEDIRHFAEGLSAGSTPYVVNQKLLSATDIQDFYRGNSHRPVWTRPANGSRLRRDLIRAINTSGAHGFNPSNYHLEKLTDPTTSDFAMEILATDAFLTQARHRKIGAVIPQMIDPEWHLNLGEINVVALLEQALADGDIAENLEQLWPKSREYWTLVTKRAELLASPSMVSAYVPPGPILKPGQSDQRIAILKARLLGSGDYSPDYDDQLLEAVKAFQYTAGLNDDGIVGPATLEVLNATRFSWVDRLDANLERWRWLPDAIPDTLLRINIAAFQLRAINNGADALNMRVIVGKPYRHTPVFTETMKYLVYNPYWNVPYSIATKDKLPLLKKDAAALEALGYEVKAALSEKFVGVGSIDWRDITPRQFDYLLRQKPGPKNALGRIKFMLPNQFSVYLHDTPDHHLFQKQERGFSSGCIRLSQPLLLAEWILQNDGQVVAADSIQKRLESGETQSVYLKNSLPVLIVYFTAFTDERDQVIFRRDVYQRDDAIIAELRKGV